MKLKKRLYQNYNPPFPLDYVNDLGEAIIRVEEKYCKWAYDSNANRIQKIERVFAYELYHQLRLLSICDIKYQNLRIDGEIGKKIQYNSPIETCGFEIENLNKMSLLPDLVIHNGQNNREKEDQKIIIEIKTRNLSDENELKKTLLKLNHYLRVLDFQYAIFLSVNTNYNELKEKIRLITQNMIPDCYERLDRIIIINYAERVIDAKTLRSIIDNR